MRCTRTNGKSFANTIGLEITPAKGAAGSAAGMGPASRCFFGATGSGIALGTGWMNLTAVSTAVPTWHRTVHRTRGL